MSFVTVASDPAVGRADSDSDSAADDAVAGAGREDVCTVHAIAACSDAAIGRQGEVKTPRISRARTDLPRSEAWSVPGLCLVCAASAELIALDPDAAVQHHFAHALAVHAQVVVGGLWLQQLVAAEGGHLQATQCLREVYLQLQSLLLQI